MKKLSIDAVIVLDGFGCLEDVERAQRRKPGSVKIEGVDARRNSAERSVLVISRA